MKSEKKKIFVEKQNSPKMKDVSMYLYSKVPCKLFQKNKVHTGILKCIGLKKNSTSSI